MSKYKLAKVYKKNKHQNNFVLKKGEQQKSGKMQFKHSELKNNYIFNPKISNNEHLEVFKRMVKEYIKKLKVKKFGQANIWKTIKEIEKKRRK